MSWYLTVQPVEFEFDHLSKTEFEALVAKVKAIENIEYDKDLMHLKITRRGQTISYSGDFRGGGQTILEPFFGLISQHLPADMAEERPPYYVDTHGDSGERSFFQEGEGVRYVIGPGYVTEERVYISEPFLRYVNPTLRPLTEEERAIYSRGLNGVDLDRCIDGLRHRAEILERERGDADARSNSARPAPAKAAAKSTPKPKRRG